MEEYLTISQAAEKLGVNPETLRRWDKSGKFQSLRHPVNNYRVYTESQISSLVEDIQLEITYPSLNIKENLMKPYFESQYGKLYKEDAIKFLKGLDSNSVDLIFADPPYNIKKAEWDTFNSQKEYVEWSMNWIREASRVLTKKGS